MLALMLIVLVPSALGQHYMLNLDCTKYPGPCNNDCYATYVADKSLNLNYNGATGENGRRRAEAGCLSSNPCKNGKMATQNSDEDSCDEYPFASVVEGGSGAILRCTELAENKAEGSDLSGFLSSTCGGEPCTFTITFGNPDGGNTPYCSDGGGANDGFEYTYQGNGNYQLAGRANSTGTANGVGWALHKPDPADYFPPHLRREFLLSDGSRTVHSSRDQNASYDDAVFYSPRNGTVHELRVVKELRGLEKSPGLQDPALRSRNTSSTTTG